MQPAFAIPIKKLKKDHNIVVLVDGDVVAYQASYGKTSVESVATEVKNQLDRIYADTDAGHMIIYLTGKGNFRNEVSRLQQYKGNRYNPDGSRKTPQPALLPQARYELEAVYGAEMQHTQEADDALTIAQTAFNAEYEAGRSSIRSIISTIDKDLRICPGLHHNIGSAVVDEVTRLGSLYKKGSDCKGSGLHFFYAQLLMGDGTDNIKGLPAVTEEMVVSYGLRRGGCGGTGAYNVLADCTTEYEMFARVYECYDSYWQDTPDSARTMPCIDWQTGEDLDNDTTLRLTEMGQLLWMRTYNEELWVPPTALLERFFTDEDSDSLLIHTEI